MNALLNQSRFAFFSIIAAFVSLVFSPSTRAAQPGLPDDACQLRWEESELCGWTRMKATEDSETAWHSTKSHYPATHDSITFPSITLPTTPTPEPISASDTTANGVITQGAAIAIASAGISVEQLLEPFSIAAPYLDRSLATVRQYQSWWGAAISNADRKHEKSITSSRETTMEKQLNEIAIGEPIDIESYGASVIVEQFPVNVQLISEGEPGIEILPLNRSVGSTAIIVTIEEAYMPYDLSNDDIKLWSVLPSSSQPFCIRAEQDALDTAAMWHDFDQRVTSTASPREASPTERPNPAAAPCGSADGLMDSCIWYLDTWVVGYSKRENGATANQLGRQIALLSLQQEQLVHHATVFVASHWHQPPPVGPELENNLPEASPAGAALLARAGAIVAESPVHEVAASNNLLR